ncbi:MAG TPA: hypothetical protein VMR41_00345 [Patescibacteria group bacterium]|nr:hypothetical protein [Patescibacteria group bacterium]
MSFSPQPQNGRFPYSLGKSGRFYREDGRIVLKPANMKMDPIYPNTCRIQGKVVGLVRKFM